MGPLDFPRVINLKGGKVYQKRAPKSSESWTMLCRHMRFASQEGQLSALLGTATAVCVPAKEMRDSPFPGVYR